MALGASQPSGLGLSLLLSAAASFFDKCSFFTHMRQVWWCHQPDARVPFHMRIEVLLLYSNAMQPWTGQEWQFGKRLTHKKREKFRLEQFIQRPWISRANNRADERRITALRRLEINFFLSMWGLFRKSLYWLPCTSAYFTSYSKRHF